MTPLLPPRLRSQGKVLGDRREASQKAPEALEACPVVCQAASLGREELEACPEACQEVSLKAALVACQVEDSPKAPAAREEHPGSSLAVDFLAKVALAALEDSRVVRAASPREEREARRASFPAADFQRAVQEVLPVEAFPRVDLVEWARFAA